MSEIIFESKEFTDHEKNAAIQLEQAITAFGHANEQDQAKLMVLINGALMVAPLVVPVSVEGIESESGENEASLAISFFDGGDDGEAAYLFTSVEQVPSEMNQDLALLDSLFWMPLLTDEERIILINPFSKHPMRARSSQLKPLLQMAEKMRADGANPF